MDLKDLQNLPYEKRLKIFYITVIFFAIVLFGWWISDIARRINNYPIKYQGQKTIHSTADYSESLKRAKELMDKANQKMEEDLKKYDPELKALGEAVSTSTNSTSTINSTSTNSTSLPTGQAGSTLNTTTNTQ